MPALQEITIRQSNQLPVSFRLLLVKVLHRGRVFKSKEAMCMPFWTHGGPAHAPERYLRRGTCIYNTPGRHDCSHVVMSSVAWLNRCDVSLLGVWWIPSVSSSSCIRNSGRERTSAYIVLMNLSLTSQLSGQDSRLSKARCRIR